MNKDRQLIHAYWTGSRRTRDLKYFITAKGGEPIRLMPREHKAYVAAHYARCEVYYSGTSSKDNK